VPERGEGAVHHGAGDRRSDLAAGAAVLDEDDDHDRGLAGRSQADDPGVRGGEVPRIGGIRRTSWGA